eukprot:475593-Prorocentrum_minimum.AAC.1
MMIDNYAKHTNGGGNQIAISHVLFFFGFVLVKGGQRRRTAADVAGTPLTHSHATATTWVPAMARGAACRFGPCRGCPLVCHTSHVA